MRHSALLPTTVFVLLRLWRFVFIRFNGSIKVYLFISLKFIDNLIDFVIGFLNVIGSKIDYLEYITGFIKF